MTAPKTLQYQGKELHLAESRIMPEVKGSPTRFVFVDRGGNAALMQWEFEGYPIDWERLQSENKDAPKVDTEKIDKRLLRYRLYSKRYRLGGNHD